MLKIFKTGAGGPEETQTITKGCWVNCHDLKKQEIERLITELGIPEEFITDLLDVNERSRIEIEDGVILIVLRVPHKNVNEKDEDVIPYTTLPVGIIIAKDVLVTISAQPDDTIMDFFEGRTRNLSTSIKGLFILKLYYRIALRYMKYLREINISTGEIETELHRSTKNEELIKLLNLEKSLVFFTTSLRSNELVIERLQKLEAIRLGEEDRDWLEDVIIENKQAIEMANIYSNILSSMMDAFASVISNNQNQVLKILTTVTIILMIPTLIASIYGMNVDLPLQHESHAFAIVIGVSLLISIIGILVFRLRRMF